MSLEVLMFVLIVVLFAAASVIVLLKFKNAKMKMSTNILKIKCAERKKGERKN